MRLKRLLPLVLLALFATLAAPLQAAPEAERTEPSFSLPGYLFSTLADLLGLERLMDASEKGPGMDPAGEPNEGTPSDDPQSTTTTTDDGEKGPGMDPAG